MPPSTLLDVCLCYSYIDGVFGSGASSFSSTTDAVCSSGHARAATWLQASRVSSWHAISSSSRLPWPSSRVSFVRCILFHCWMIRRPVFNLLNESRLLAIDMCVCSSTEVKGKYIEFVLCASWWFRHYKLLGYVPGRIAIQSLDLLNRRRVFNVSTLIDVNILRPCIHLLINQP
jgi:hypothetical protein